MEKTFKTTVCVCVCVCIFVGDGGSGDGAGMRDNAGTMEREALESEGQGLSLGSSFLLCASGT